MWSSTKCNAPYVITREATTGQCIFLTQPNSSVLCKRERCTSTRQKLRNWLVNGTAWRKSLPYTERYYRVAVNPPMTKKLMGSRPQALRRPLAFNVCNAIRTLPKQYACATTLISEESHGGCGWPGAYLVPRHLKPWWWRRPVGAPPQESPDLMCWRSKIFDSWLTMSRLWPMLELLFLIAPYAFVEVAAVKLKYILWVWCRIELYKWCMLFPHSSSCVWQKRILTGRVAAHHFNKIWRLCIVSTSTTRFASNVG